MNILISDILLVAAAFIWIIFACITDLKKREVPNWLSFSLIAIALAVRGITALLTSQPFYFLYALISLGVFFAIVNLLYYSRVFGGGDAKLLLALAAIFATTPIFVKTYAIFPEHFMLTFIINIFALGFAYALIFSAVSAVKNRKKFISKFRKENKKIRYIRLSLWAAAVIVILISFFIDSVFKPLILFLFAVLFIAPLLYSFIKAVENSVMIKKIKPGQLAEGDYLVNPVKLKKMIIKPNVHGLNLKEIILLKKVDKQVAIKIGLPFVPMFLLALVCSLIFGNLLTKLILLFI